MDLTTAVPFDSKVFDRLNPTLGYTSVKTVSEGVPSEGCVGQCSVGSGVNSSTHSCNSVFSKDPYNVASYAVGWVGGPTTLVKGVLSGVSDVKGVGSLGLVCSQWGDSFSYTDRWSDVYVVGLMRENMLNKDVFEWNKSRRLTDVGRLIPLEFNDGLGSVVLRPVPMKLCPTPSVLKGVGFSFKNGRVVGLSRLICQQLEDSSVVEVNLYSGLSEFRQLIGRPTSSNIQVSACPNGVVNGFELFYNDDVVGVRVMCDGEN